MGNNKDDPFTVLILGLFILSLPFIIGGILIIVTTPVDRPDDRFQSQSFPSFVCEKFGGHDCDDLSHAKPTVNPTITHEIMNNTIVDNNYQNRQTVIVNYRVFKSGK
jgi:hypothetical protein